MGPGISIRLVQFRYTACLNLVVPIEVSCLSLDIFGGCNGYTQAGGLQQGLHHTGQVALHIFQNNTQEPRALMDRIVRGM